MSFGGFGSFGGYGGYGNPALSMALHELMDAPTPQPRVMASTTSTTVPKVEVKEFPSGALVLAVSMPAGVSPADVRVQVEDGNVLAIGTVAAGKFELITSYPLKNTADLDGIRAEYKDGVLTVTVENLPPGTNKPRVVEVNICTVGDQRGLA